MAAMAHQTQRWKSLPPRARGRAKRRRRAAAEGGGGGGQKEGGWEAAAAEVEGQVEDAAPAGEVASELARSLQEHGAFLAPPSLSLRGRGGPAPPALAA